MEVEDFAKYVIDNISRASLSNALNITDRVLKEYNALDFCDAILNECYKYGGGLEARVLVGICKACYDFKKQLKLEKVNEKMILDNLIVNIWEASNGH